MAKRFTDSGKWNKPFIRSMKAPYKLLWLYLLDECDHAGIWQVDFDVARLKIGEKLDSETALKFFEGKIFVFENGEKWFIPDYVEFQYGVLNPENRAHNSVLKILEKYNLTEIKAHISPLQGAKDKDKDKDMDMDKGGAGGIFPLTELHLLQILIKGFVNVSALKNQLTFEEATKLSAEFSENEIKEIIEAMENKKDLQKKYTSVNLTIRGWLRLRNKNSGNGNKRVDNHHIGKQDYSGKL